MEQIDIHQAKELIDQGEVTIIDIRDEESYKESHVECAQSVNESNLEDFLRKADKESPLICYCYHGFSSQNAAQFFQEEGFKKVYSIEGGFEAWKTVYPTESNVK